ncbi:MAG: efflux RND transporter periplasmic adaptor subunit [Candidatus Dadabacteria bacterium]|nr:efflux RND transporter periplasmic adaptor subunit [Candidatus Dadabacteria bacterium]
MTITKANKHKIFGIVIVLIIASFVLYSYGSDIPLINKIPIFADDQKHEYRPVFDEEGEIDYWTCAMHPSVRLRDPGKCPICSMDTVAVWKKDNSQQQPTTQAKTEEIDSTKNGDEMSGMQGHDHSTMGVSTKKDNGGESKSTFTVSPNRQQLIGVKTEPVMIRTLDKEIRTVGMVTLDESKIYNVQTKYTGWIDKVFVDFRYQHVNIGQPLFSIYSPELVTTQEEYLLALKSKNILSDSQFPDISSGANSLLEASRRRLELLDVSSSQIKELERTGKVKTNLTVYSPVKGHVAQKNAFENMFVEPNTTIYKIADHSVVWVQVDIYENEISLVKLGQSAVMTLPSYPGEEYIGDVTFIWPHLDPETRTVKVRLEFPNPDLKFLPEMYANVVLDIPLGERLTVPGSAVLRTGKMDIVFVDKGQGNMEIRRVQLGRRAGGYYEVLRGLSEGEKVVSRANFLIDSESKIQAAAATWGEDEDDTADSDDHKPETIKKLELYPEQGPDKSQNENDNNR